MYCFTVWLDTEWSIKFIRKHKKKLKCTTDIKRALKQDHALRMFMKNEMFPEEINNLISTYVNKK